MSDSRKAIAEDTQEYLELCRRYGEKPVADPYYRDYDIYGDHARNLKKRKWADYERHEREEYERLKRKYEN